MRVAFLGTPTAAVPTLAALVDVAEVAVVVTRPDAARGRSGDKVAPPIKTAAREWGLNLAQPVTHRELLAVISEHDVDLGVVVAYGRILRPAVLSVPRYGFLNVHFSLLPRWRGAAPVERAIVAGDDVTGVSLMVLDEGMDTGPVVAVRETPIAADETGGTLTARLSYLGAELLDDTFAGFVGGARIPAAQIEAAATHAAPLTVDEARIDLQQDAAAARRIVMAFNPRPGAWTMVEGERLKIWRASLGDADIDAGQIEIHGGAPVLGFWKGSLVLDVVQPAGKRPMAGTEWVQGRRGAGAVVDPIRT
jgi:methionyl-tRNA formyltransferase